MNKNMKIIQVLPSLMLWYDTESTTVMAAPRKKLLLSIIDFFIHRLILQTNQSKNSPQITNVNRLSLNGQRRQIYHFDPLSTLISKKLLSISQRYRLGIHQLGSMADFGQIHLILAEWARLSCWWFLRTYLQDFENYIFEIRMLRASSD